MIVEKGMKKAADSLHRTVEAPGCDRSLSHAWERDVRRSRTERGQRQNASLNQAAEPLNRLPNLCAGVSGLLCILLLLCGCAYYSTSATGGAGFRTVAVPLMENASLEPGIQQALTDSLIQAFVSNGALRVVDEGQADVVLRGTVTEVVEAPFTYQQQANQQADQYQITVSLEMTCTDARNKQTLWEEKLRGYGIYSAAEQRDLARRKGLADAFRILIEDVVDRTQVGGW